MNRRRVKVTAVGYYWIEGDAVRDGTYGDEIMRHYEEGAVDQAFNEAMAFDSANVKEGGAEPQEVVENGTWETIKFEWTSEEVDVTPDPLLGQVTRHP